MTTKETESKIVKGVIRDIEVKLIDNPRDDVRKWISQEHIERLAESMNAVGLIHEPLVCEVDGRYEMVAGRCRCLAAQRLGWKTIRCKVVKKEEVERDFMKLHENLYRQDLSAVEKATFLSHVKAKYQLKDEVLAKRFGMSRTWATRVLQALKWPSDLQQANIDGVLGFEVCDVLRKVKSDEVRASYIRYAVEDGCTKRLAIQWYNEWLRNERIKENLRAREEHVEGHPLVASDDELVADAKAQQEMTVRQRLGDIRKRCSLCGGEKPLDTLISWDLCPDCVQYLYDQVKDQVQESVAPQE